MKELPRRLFHILGGLAIPIAGLLVPHDIFLPALIAITAGFFIFELVRLKSPAANRPFLTAFRPLLREEETSRPTGSSYLLIASVIAFLLFDKQVATAVLVFTVVGDPAAGLVGKRWGRRRIRHKTLEGSGACLLTCLAAGAILTAVTDLSMPLIAVGALCATIIEFLPLPINDNLTIPLISGGVMTGLSALLSG